MRALILFCALAGRAMAGLIVTADPSTSATYPANTTFDGEKSQSTAPPDRSRTSRFSSRAGTRAVPTRAWTETRVVARMDALYSTTS